MASGCAGTTCGSATDPQASLRAAGRLAAWNGWRNAATDAIQEAWTTPDWSQWGAQGVGTLDGQTGTPQLSSGRALNTLGGANRRAYPEGEPYLSVTPGSPGLRDLEDEDEECEPLELPWRKPEPCLPVKGSRKMTTAELEDECGGAPCAWKRREFPKAWDPQGFEILIHPPRFDPEVGTWRLDELCEEIRLVRCALTLILENPKFVKLAACVARGKQQDADCVMDQLLNHRFVVKLDAGPSPSALASVVDPGPAQTAVKVGAALGFAFGLLASGPVAAIIWGLLGAGVATAGLVASIRNIRLFVRNPTVAAWVSKGLKGGPLEETQCARLAVLLLHEIAHLCGMYLLDALDPPAGDVEDCDQKPVLAQTSFGWLLSQRYSPSPLAEGRPVWYSSELGYPDAWDQEAVGTSPCAM